MDLQLDQLDLVLKLPRDIYLLLPALKIRFFLSKREFDIFIPSISPSVTRGCWWYLRQCKTAAYTKWHAATDTTGCPLCVGGTLAPKQCCSAPEASTARVWWACSSRRTPPQQVHTQQHDSLHSIEAPVLWSRC